MEEPESKSRLKELNTPRLVEQDTIVVCKHVEELSIEQGETWRRARLEGNVTAGQNRAISG